MWDEYWQPQLKRCFENNGFWWSALYGSNWMDGHTICYLPAWYVAADLQLYLAAPIVASALYLWPRRTVLTLIAASVASSAAVGILIGVNNDPPTVIYDPPIDR